MPSDADNFLVDEIPIPAKSRRDMKAACDLQFELKGKDLERLRVDLADVRGGRVLDQIEGDIRDARRGAYRTVLFSGHVGSGKTTELRWLTHELEKEKEGRSFHVLWVDALEYLDINSVQLPEFLVAVFNAIAEDPLLRPLLGPSRTAKKLWASVRAWLKSIDVDLDLEIPVGVAKLKAKVKTEFGLQKRMRETLRERVTELMADLSDLLIDLRAGLVNNGIDDLVIVADNLEKIVFAELDHQSAKNTHDLFFIEQLPIVQRLGAHIILTVPVSLHFAHARLRQVFLNPTVKVLPMVPVHQARAPKKPHERGIAVLKSLLSKRVDTAILFADDAAFARAIELSGGVIRDLFRIVLESLSLKPAMGLTVADVEAGVRDIVSSYERMLQGKPYLPGLHEIAACSCFPVGFDAAARNALLHSMVVLEYNGETWYDVHPLARRTRAYLSAVPAATS
ncbi:hypothetical protein [Nannocystis radixulma]|uniref:Orc1-like AAA ATPase domain-containing protein n=1 Tax=Nannocystis radixulma TaxID=2995305 RepID=A0ABT5BC65_9BACT|nr:hypothetical protein [Nannocystis radixulma]MDC0671129.1 hypothetical protein [Nannocystis radixulma]